MDVVCPNYNESEFYDAVTDDHYQIVCYLGFQAPGVMPPHVKAATGCFNACTKGGRQPRHRHFLRWRQLQLRQ